MTIGFFAGGGGGAELFSLKYNASNSNFLSMPTSDFAANGFAMDGEFTLFTWVKMSASAQAISLVSFGEVPSSPTVEYAMSIEANGNIAIYFGSTANINTSFINPAVYSDIANRWCAVRVYYKNRTNPSISDASLEADFICPNAGISVTLTAAQSALAVGTNFAADTLPAGQSVVLGAQQYGSWVQGADNYYQWSIFKDANVPFSTLIDTTSQKPRPFRDVASLYSLVPINSNPLDDFKLVNWTANGTVTISSDTPS